MKKSLIIAFTVALLYSTATEAQISPKDKGYQSINTGVIRSLLGFLASDWMEGRRAGERGENIASDYIASQLQLFGVEPYGDYFGGSNRQYPPSASERTYFQNFYLLKTSPGDKQNMVITTKTNNIIIKKEYVYNIDYSIRMPDENIEIEAPVVFAGYGLKIGKLRIDDFGKLDIKGKFVLKLSGIPGIIKEKLTQAELSAAMRETETIARQMGAIGIIEINPGITFTGSRNPDRTVDESPSENRPYPSGMSARYTLKPTDSKDTFVRLLITARAGDELLKGSGTSLAEYIKRSESLSLSSLPEIKGKSIFLKTSVISEMVRVRNVIGLIKGSSDKEYIVLGAHYDHMGKSGGYIWNGADDNASGSAGVMAIAKAFMETGTKPEKSIIVALWTAEEVGLLGSRYFVENMPVEKEKVILNMNFDMISRYISDDQPNKVTMTYTDSKPVFRTITEDNLKKYGIELDVDYQASADPPGGTDHRSFVEAGIPVIRFKPGHREEYHTPEDEISTVDWDIMEKIIQVSYSDLWDLANTRW